MSTSPWTLPSLPRFDGLFTVARHRETSLAVVLVLTVLATAMANPRFVSAQNLRDMALNVDRKSTRLNSSHT